MQYRLITGDDGKLLRDNGCYYAVALNGSKGVVTREWVKMNANYITNITVSGNTVYSVADRFNKAITIIERDIEKRIRSAKGYNKEADVRMIQFGKNITSDKLLSSSTSKEAWDYIKSLDIGTDALLKLHSNIFNQVCGRLDVEQIQNSGETIWRKK